MPEKINNSAHERVNLPPRATFRGPDLVEQNRVSQRNCVRISGMGQVLHRTIQGEIPRADRSRGDTPTLRFARMSESGAFVRTREGLTGTKNGHPRHISHAFRINIFALPGRSEQPQTVVLNRWIRSVEARENWS